MPNGSRPLAGRGSQQSWIWFLVSLGRIEFNSLLPRDVIWHHRSCSSIVHVMAYCLMAPSLYLNQFWIIISEVLYHLPERNFTGHAWDIYPWYDFENYSVNITGTSIRDQGVKYLFTDHMIFFKMADKMTVKGLTHCGLVVPYGNIDLVQHCLR